MQGEGVMPPPGDNESRKDDSPEASVANVPPDRRVPKLHPGFLEEPETSVFRPRILGVKPPPDFRGRRNLKILGIALLAILILLIALKTRNPAQKTSGATDASAGVIKAK